MLPEIEYDVGKEDEVDPMERTVAVPADQGGGSALEVLTVFFKLGLTSFGGPVAHLGYFRDEIVARRRWVDEETYADLVALCQFLPGPASSQVGIALGTARAGTLGGLAAWMGFTLPSALALTLFALGIGALGDVSGAGWLQGLKIVAVAVVAHALWGMATKLCPDRLRATFAIVAAILLLLWPTAIAQVAVIVVAGLVGWRVLSGDGQTGASRVSIAVPGWLATASWVVLPVLLLGLPLVSRVSGNNAVHLFDSFFRAGALVFGGGHVVLPLLEQAVVPNGWVPADVFIAGYGAAQAVPGPLFTFAAFLGAANTVSPSGWAGATLATLAIFLPSFLLLWAVLPFWNRLRAAPGVQAALRGINAAVVGLLLAALYTPTFTSAIRAPIDLALALGAFALLMFWKAPPWLVVLFSALVGAVML
jgi:chromate transporter